MCKRSASSSCLAVLICLALALPALLSGQAYFGTISGELTDATGAVVPGVTVVLSDQQKGFMFNATSDSSGRYLFRSIPPGVYTVSAEAKGFDRAQSASVKLDVNQNVTANLTPESGWHQPDRRGGCATPGHPD